MACVKIAKTVKTQAVGGVCALASMAFAVSGSAVASAEPDTPFGPYTMTNPTNGKTQSVDFRPCAPGCVTMTGAIGPLDLHLEDQSWSASSSDIVKCAITQAPGEFRISFDATSLAGTIERTFVEPCGDYAAGFTDSTPFELSKTY